MKIFNNVCSSCVTICSFGGFDKLGANILLIKTIFQSETCLKANTNKIL